MITGSQQVKLMKLHHSIYSYAYGEKRGFYTSPTVAQLRDLKDRLERAGFTV